MEAFELLYPKLNEIRNWLPPGPYGKLTRAAMVKYKAGVRDMTPRHRRAFAKGIRRRAARLLKIARRLERVSKE